MKKRSKPPKDSAPSTTNQGKLTSQESSQPKTKSGKTKVQPIRGPLASGSPTSETNPESLSSGKENKNFSAGKKPLSTPRPLVKLDRSKDALKRLGVDEEQLARSEKFTPTLRKARGGLKAVLNAMRFCAHDGTLAAFLEKYDAVPIGDRDKLSWEAIALAAELNLQQVYGAIMFAIQNSSVNTVKIMAWSAHPSVMKKTIKYAEMASGERDRTTIHQALGFLPSPKGPTFIGKAVFGGAGQATNANVSDDGPEPVSSAFADADVDNLFPSSSATQNRLIPIRQRLLEGGSTVNENATNE